VEAPGSRGTTAWGNKLHTSIPCTREEELKAEDEEERGEGHGADTSREAIVRRGNRRNRTEEKFIQGKYSGRERVAKKN